MELDQFFLDSINKILEYLDQEILTIYIRRTVDAFIAGYFLLDKFADTAQLKIADWPPDAGICLGFRCDGFYVNENEVGIEGNVFKLKSPTPISYTIYKLTKLITTTNRDDLLKLYIGIYSWLVDNCTTRCNDPMDIITELGARQELSLPFPEAPLGRSLSLTTLPILPGVLGRGVKEDRPLGSLDPKRVVDILDEALGAVYEAGFYPALADKWLRYVPEGFDIATKAVELEALLAGFTPDANGVESYVELLSKTLENILNNRSNIININNIFFIYKLSNYLPYFIKIKGLVALRAETNRGFVTSLIAPFKEAQRLRGLAERLKELGHIIEFESSILIYVPRDKWPEASRLLQLE
ncbi:MAG: hypothetical protein ABWJ97_05880 [Thermoproteus sp.]